jgi:hypothetical protein
MNPKETVQIREYGHGSWGESALTSEVVELEPLTGLAPAVLLEHQNELNKGIGSVQCVLCQFGALKEGHAGGWNTISFAGGDLKMDLTYEPHQFLNTTSNEEVSKSLAKDEANKFVKAAFDLGIFFFQININYEYLSKTALATTYVTTRTTKQESEMKFHFQDPHFGDYFVVTVWKDPEYLTPIFAINGGASSCTWEEGTAHRTQPTMRVEYVGAERVPPTQPALFKVTVANENNYYMAGTSGGKNRPGWMPNDHGYFQPSFTIAVVRESIEGGLRVMLNGAPLVQRDAGFHLYGKRSDEMLLDVYRGPDPNIYVYAAPIVIFGERCEYPGAEMAADVGERASDTELGTSGPAGSMTIEYMRACPEVGWSGEILSRGSFTAHKVDNKVGFAVVSPTGVPWRASPHFIGLRFEYRYAASSNPTDWRIDPDVWKISLSDTATLATGEWIPAAGTPQGKYELRIISQCRDTAGPKEFEHSTTAVVSGIVDEIQPEIVTVVTTAGPAGFSADDLVTVTFTETIFCAGINPQTGNNVAASLVLAVRGVKFEGDQIKWGCHGNIIQISLAPVGRAEFLQTRQAATGDQLQVAISGIIDQAGNELFDPVAGNRRSRRTAIAGPAVTLVAQKCAAVQFVGSLVDFDGFVVTARTPQVSFAVANPSGETFGADGVSSLTFEYSEVSTRIWSAPLTISSGDSGMNVAHVMYTHDFGDLAAYPSGSYRVRVQALCGAAFIPSRADVMLGVVDRAAAEALVASRPLDNLILITFNEPIVCTSATIANVRFTNAPLIKSTSSDWPTIDILCYGSVMSLKIKAEPKLLRKKLDSIAFAKVSDVAGNVASGVELGAQMFETELKSIQQSAESTQSIVQDISDGQTCKATAGARKRGVRSLQPTSDP